MLSEIYVKQKKEDLLSDIENQVNYFLIELGGGKAMFPFPVNESEAGKYPYFLISDLDEGIGFDGLEALVDKLFSEYEIGDHLCALVNGKVVKSVKFYIGKAFQSLKDALEFAPTVGINHIIYSAMSVDKFKFVGDDIVYTSE